MNKEAIESLKDGEVYIFEDFAESGAEVWRKNDMYFLFLIPEFGGSPVFHDAYSLHRIDSMIDDYNTMY